MEAGRSAWQGIRRRPFWEKAQRPTSFQQPGANTISHAANGGTGLQDLFTKNNSNPLTNGFALKFDTLASGVLSSSGAVTNKAAALQRELQRNADAQEKVNERAAVVEARLNKQYSALDARMAQLTALNAFVAQQVTLWNNAGNSN